MDNMNNLEEFYGIVAEDLDIDNNSWFVKINPIEKVPNTDGVGNSQSNNNVKSKDMLGNIADKNVVSSKVITAKWSPENCTNHIFAPSVTAGTKVLVFRYNDSDEYRWRPVENQVNIRKEERFGLIFSAKKKIENVFSGLEKYWYFIIDTKKQFIEFRTQRKNGEATSYSLDINAKDGEVNIADDHSNGFRLKSTKGEMDFYSTKSITRTTKDILDTGSDNYGIVTKKYKLSAGEEVEIVTDNFTLRVGKTINISGVSVNITSDTNISVVAPTVKIGGGKIDITAGNVVTDTKNMLSKADNESLIQILLDLIDANISEKHIDSINGLTRVEPSSVEKYKDIKSRLKKFLLGA